VTRIVIDGFMGDDMADFLNGELSIALNTQMFTQNCVAAEPSIYTIQMTANQ